MTSLDSFAPLFALGYSMSLTHFALKTGRSSSSRTITIRARRPASGPDEVGCRRKPNNTSGRVTVDAEATKLLPGCRPYVWSVPGANGASRCGLSYGDSSSSLFDISQMVRLVVRKPLELSSEPMPRWHLTSLVVFAGAAGAATGFGLRLLWAGLLRDDGD